MLAELTENISRRLASPFATSQRPKEKQCAVPDTSYSSVKQTPLIFASSSSHPEKAPDLTAPSPSHRSHQNPYGIKPKNEKEISGLGPATIEFITAQNLTQFCQIISLIVMKNSPTKWSTMLGVLSLPDNVRKG